MTKTTMQLVRVNSRPKIHKRNVHIEIIEATTPRPVINLLPRLEILKDTMGRKEKVTEQFNDLVSLLTDKRLK